MTSRLDHLKNSILSAEPRLCIERARIYTRVYQENEHLPIVRKRALALRKTLEESGIYINDEELIVGNTASRARSAAIFPEYAVNWLFKEIDSIDDRPAESYAATDEMKAEIKDLCAWWKSRTLQDRAMENFDPVLKAINESGIVHAEGNMTAGDGHIAANMRRVLDLGIGGYATYVKSKNDALDLPFTKTSRNDNSTSACSTSSPDSRPGFADTKPSHGTRLQPAGNRAAKPNSKRLPGTARPSRIRHRPASERHYNSLASYSSLFR